MAGSGRWKYPKGWSKADTAARETRVGEWVGGGKNILARERLPRDEHSWQKWLRECNCAAGVGFVQPSL